MSSQEFIILICSNIFTALVCLLYADSPFHRHYWTDWDDWLPSKRGVYTLAVRYRRCDDCGKVQAQEVGDHICYYNQCPHVSQIGL